jgi:hypothetical protein
VAIHSNLSGGDEFVEATGFKLIGDSYVLERNTATGNAGAGFVLGISGNSDFFKTSVASFRQNNVIGNVGPGIVVWYHATISNFWGNNIFGNGVSRQLVFGLSGSNCGIWNGSGYRLQAQGSYWGAASGPGADPADAAGGGYPCDAGGSVTLPAPFASQYQY